MHQIEPHNGLEKLILTIRSQKVILAQDLAALFDVEVKRLNEQVKRNKERFPSDFMFQLAEDEFKEIVVAKCDRNFKMLRTLPYVFTEHGALMAANVLNSPRAVEMSIYVVRAFVAMRQMSSGIRELADRVNELDEKYIRHDKILNLIATVMSESKGFPGSQEVSSPKKKIGFQNRKQ